MTETKTTADARTQRINDRVRLLLGQSYSWDGELYYRGDPCVARATDYEDALLERAITEVHEEMEYERQSEEAIATCWNSSDRERFGQE